MANKIVLDFKGNTELANALGTKKVGDTVKLEVSFIVDSLDNEGLQGSIKSVAPEGYEGAPGTVNEGEPEIEPNPNEPVMVLIAAKNKANAA